MKIVIEYNYAKGRFELLSFIIQIALAALSVSGFWGHDFSLFPYFALGFLIIDVIGIVSGALKTMNIPISVCCCIGSCLWFREVNLYTISIGYVAMNVVFVGIGIVVWLFGIVASILLSLKK